MKTAASTPANPEPCAVWTLIKDRLPNIDDRIACMAAHRDGGYMEWAGRVARIDHGFVLLETRGQETRRFVLTPDTLWIRLPLAYPPTANPERRYPRNRELRSTAIFCKCQDCGDCHATILAPGQEWYCQHCHKR